MTGKLDAKKSPMVGAVSDVRLPQQEWLSGLKRKFPVSRFIRVTLGLAILLIGAWFFLPGLLFPISSNAVVNAHVITLRAPIAGDVSFTFSGTDRPIAKGDIVTRLENNRVDDSQLSAMQAQQATLQEKIGAIEQELLELEALERRLKTSSTKYRRAVGSRYDAILAEAIARLSARRAIAGEAATNLQRQRALYAKRLTTLAALDTASMADRVAQADLHEAEQAVERIHVEKSSASQGIYFGDGYNNVPYSQQRVDDIQLRTQALRSELRDARIRQKESERQIAVEQARLSRLTRAELPAPAAGRLWLQLASNGEYVTAGAPLLQILDTSRLFLMVSLDERHFDDIAVGDLATVDLIGSGESLHGKVERIQGNESKVDESVLAVAPPPVKPREFLVVINLNTKELLSRKADIANQVGRRAKVTFGKSS
ncbi:MAG: HlyD family efflux transporter periplasmic adaptor subunit [Gammaproteobacteria bacterium]|nr:HlyD family efflux transporter periplasmic adaptor subunit [Gammaproteobacteria bacterium]